MAQSNSNNNGDEVELISSFVRCHLDDLLSDLGVIDHSVVLTEGAVRGDNYLGVIVKAAIKGRNTKTDEKVSLNFVIKSAPSSGVVRDLGPLREIFDREIYIYNRVFPEFEQLQNERGVVQNRFASYAKFYNSTMQNLNETLIMDDMGSFGFKMLNRRLPINYEHALLVMREYGRLHALSLAMREHKPVLFDELAENLHERVITFWKKNDEICKAMKKQNRRALNAIDPINDPATYQRFESFYEDGLNKSILMVEAGAAGKYTVIGHGDNWINNMLFKYNDLDAPHKPTHLCLLDWQLARIGSPALDLSYFLCTCTDKKLRDEHYDDLLKEYHDSLSKLLIELGCDPTKLFPFEALQQQLKKFSAFGLYMSIMVLYFMLSETEEIPDIHKNDYEKGEEFEKFNFQTKNIGEYYTRLRDVVLDFVKFDYDF